MGTITITDYNGGQHTVLAAKPKSHRAGDRFLLTVLHIQNGTHVVHTMNLECPGFSTGTYCKDLEQAITVFEAR
jgi:hypothetical protein